MRAVIRAGEVFAFYPDTQDTDGLHPDLEVIWCPNDSALSHSQDADGVVRAAPDPRISAGADTSALWAANHDKLEARFAANRF